MNKLLNSNTEITVGVDSAPCSCFHFERYPMCLGQVVTRDMCLGQVVTRVMFFEKNFLFEGDPLLYSCLKEPFIF